MFSCLSTRLVGFAYPCSSSNQWGAAICHSPPFPKTYRLAAVCVVYTIPRLPLPDWMPLFQVWNPLSAAAARNPYQTHPEAVAYFVCVSLLSPVIKACIKLLKYNALVCSLLNRWHHTQKYIILFLIYTPGCCIFQNLGGGINKSTFGIFDNQNQLIKLRFPFTQCCSFVHKSTKFSHPSHETSENNFIKHFLKINS